MFVVIEGGGCSRGLADHPAGIVKIKRDGSFRYVADISAFIRSNPVANEPLCGPQGDCEPDGVPHPLPADDRWLGPITDLAFAGGRLHVLETFSGEPFSANSGRIVRRNRDGRRTVIAERLNFPVGMAIGGGAYRRGLYVTTVGYGQGPVRGRGRIVRVRLH
jgi:hypothetical protein